MRTPYADLHMHTAYSDGQLPPRALVHKARQRGLKVIAVTDHDSIAAWPELRRASAEAGGPTVVPGVELSVSVDDREVHLLGYFFDPDHQALNDHLNAFAQARHDRAVQMTRQLQEAGVGLSFEAVLDEVAEDAVIGRPHVAMALVEAGHVADVDEAFDRYLRDGKVAYVAKPAFPAEEALRMLHDAGGIGVLAHPSHWTSSHTIRHLVDAGMDGIEVIHPSHDASLRAYYQRLARDYRLLTTGGSDFHGHRPHDDEHFGRLGISQPAWERLQQAVA